MSSTKFYKTIQDLPTIEVGAILKKQYDDYRLVSDFYGKDNVPEDQAVNVYGWVVENSPEFFERVYQIPGTEAFGTKEQARAAVVATNTVATDKVEQA